MSDTRFLCVDVEVKSRQSLTPLVDGLGDDVLVLYNSNVSELNVVAFQWAGDDGGAEQSLSNLCSLIESLSDSARACWDRSLLRVFDLGFECGNGSATFRATVNVETVRSVADLGATFVFTIYPVGDENVD